MKNSPWVHVWDALSVELIARAAVKAAERSGGVGDSRSSPLVTATANRINVQRLPVVPVVIVAGRLAAIGTSALGRVQQQSLFDGCGNLGVGCVSTVPDTPLTSATKAGGGVVMALGYVDPAMGADAGHLSHLPQNRPIDIRAQQLALDTGGQFNIRAAVSRDAALFPIS